MKETAEEKLERLRLMTNARTHKHRAKLKKLGLPINRVKNEWFLDYKKTLSCKVCGESCDIVLDFHHLDPKVKTNNISRLIATNASASIVLAEIAKCVVLCRNCHAKVHAGLIIL